MRYGRTTPMLAGLLALSALGAGGGDYAGLNRVLAGPKKETPERVKTPADLARIEAARIKRDRKAAKRNPTTQ